MSFAGKVAFITGASSGIGEALALELARQGASVVVTGRRRGRLDALAARLQADGKKALALTVDVTDEATLQEAVAATVAHFGKLDVLIANAGFGVAGNFEDLSQQDYQRQFDTNVFGVMSTLRAGLTELKRSKGQFVIMGSVSGYASVPGTTPYSMSKFAVRGLAYGVGPELARSGVGLTHLVPGFVDSEIRKTDNYGKVDDAQKDPIPAFVRMSSAEAARQMLAAIAKRRREAVITGHGKFFVFLCRYFPGVTNFLLRRMSRGKNKAYSFSRK